MSGQEDVEAPRQALRQTGLHIHFVLPLATEADATLRVQDCIRVSHTCSCIAYQQSTYLYSCGFMSR